MRMNAPRITRYDIRVTFHLCMSSLTDSVFAAFDLITQYDPMLWSVVARSLWVSVWATAIASVVGICFGAWLAVSRFYGRSVLLTVLNTLLALPSVVVGLVVYLLLSRSGPLGHLGWLFSLKAMVLARTPEANFEHAARQAGGGGGIDSGQGSYQDGDGDGDGDAAADRAQ
jgi:ABC-type glycerol-3-phosphate transport system permease component